MQSQTKEKKLVVVISPDKFDRNTEKHFTDLFSLGIDFIQPDNEKWELEEDQVLLFEGGTDVNPSIYGEAKGKWTQESDDPRDKHEIKIIEEAKKKGIPMIGVCRGAQLLCVMNGGSLIQHVKEKHNKTHIMTAVVPQHKRIKKSETEIWVVSAHHQLMNPYVLEKDKWVSYGYHPDTSPYLYFDQHDNKMGQILHQKFPNFKEQEIVWFPETRSLCIQGHPEWVESSLSSFVIFCRFLVRRLILGDKEVFF